MTPAADTTRQTPFPRIREDMVARLSRQAATLSEEKPAPTPVTKKRRWFH